jgi:DNA-directed RNA polymerase subunit RPC12/RpoP
VQIPRRTKRALTPALIASLTPAGQNITNDDYRCIYCYEFPTESDKQVVICPHCKHPSHADEFQKWLQVSNICSRCNKPVNNVKMIRISGSSYQKIIQMFQKKYKN